MLLCLRLSSSAVTLRLRLFSDIVYVWLGGLCSERGVENSFVNPSFFALATESVSLPIWYVTTAVTSSLFFFLQVIFSHSLQQESAAAVLIVMHGPVVLLD